MSNGLSCQGEKYPGIQIAVLQGNACIIVRFRDVATLFGGIAYITRLLQLRGICGAGGRSGTKILEDLQPSPSSAPDPPYRFIRTIGH